VVTSQATGTALVGRRGVFQPVFQAGASIPQAWLGLFPAGSCGVLACVDEEGGDAGMASRGAVLLVEVSAGTEDSRMLVGNLYGTNQAF